VRYLLAPYSTILSKQEDISGVVQFQLQPVKGVVGRALNNFSSQIITGMTSAADKSIIFIGFEGGTAPEGTD